MRYFGVCPYAVASQSCCAVQASVGDRVTPTWFTFRDRGSMMKNAKSERKNRSVTWRRVPCPDLSCMIAQKRQPALPRWARRTHAPHVLLDGPFADVKIQLQECTPHAFSPPKPIVLCHVFDQCHGLSLHLWFIRSGFRLVLPEKTRIPDGATAKGSSSWTSKSACLQNRVALARSTSRLRSLLVHT